MRKAYPVFVLLYLAIAIDQFLPRAADQMTDLADLFTWDGNQSTNNCPVCHNSDLKLP